MADDEFDCSGKAQSQLAQESLLQAHVEKSLMDVTARPSKNDARPALSAKRSRNCAALSTGRKKRTKLQWPGCHVAHENASWILGVEPLEEHDATFPDISIDPDEKVLSVINNSNCQRCFFLSLPADCCCVSSSGRRLETGWARSEDGTNRAVIAFVLVVKPHQLMDVCELADVENVHDIDIHSDILDLVPTLSPAPGVMLPEPRVYGFPLAGIGPYLCSQGSGGRLTHFAHPSTYHAVDFNCAVGTEVVAIADGVVQGVRDFERVSGIDVDYFFRWNQVTIKQHDGAYVEYVHIAAGSASARIQEGDKVRRGQVLCLSGDIGFCPSPHLHLEVHVESSDRAPSVPFLFDGAAGPFACEEGLYYSRAGPTRVVPASCNSTARL